MNTLVSSSIVGRLVMSKHRCYIISGVSEVGTVKMSPVTDETMRHTILQVYGRVNGKNVSLVTLARNKAENIDEFLMRKLKLHFEVL